MFAGDIVANNNDSTSSGVKIRTSKSPYENGGISELTTIQDVTGETSRQTTTHDIKMATNVLVTVNFLYNFTVNKYMFM